jgi:phosphate transport system substrate-binding protein
VKLTPTGRLAGLLTLTALGVTACGTDVNTPRGGATPRSTVSATNSGGVGGFDCAAGNLSGAGSTFAQNIFQQWIKDFQAACPDATVNYQGVGSGAGITQFGAGTIDFAGSDSAMKDEEQAKADARCKTGTAIHLPITAGGVGILYNLDGVKDLQLSPATIAGIFQGDIKRWDDAAIRADNPGATLPSTAIQAFHRSDGSGTTDVFSKFLDATAGSAWKLGTGKELDWSGGQGAKGSDGVTAGVKGAGGGIGYAEVSFAQNNDLPVAKVKNAGGTYVALTGATVGKALTEAKITGTGNNLTAQVNFEAEDPGSYPISTLSYAIVCEQGGTAEQVPLLKAFLTYSATKGQESAEGLGYAPLPGEIADRVVTAIGALA